MSYTFSIDDGWDANALFSAFFSLKASMDAQEHFICAAQKAEKNKQSSKTVHMNMKAIKIVQAFMSSFHIFFFCNSTCRWKSDENFFIRFLFFIFWQRWKSGRKIQLKWNIYADTVHVCISPRKCPQMAESLNYCQTVRAAINHTLYLDKRTIKRTDIAWLLSQIDSMSPTRALDDNSHGFISA